MSVMPFSLISLRVDPSDLDAYGYVNAIAIVKYFQAARIHYWEHAGIVSYHKENGIGPIVVSCKIDARIPLFYPGQVKIQSRITRIGNCSFGMFHELFNEAGKSCVVSEETMVMFDFLKKEKFCFPPEIRDRIQELEGETSIG